MVLVTRRNTGKQDVVEYREQDSDDDRPMKDIVRIPPRTAEEPPTKKLCRGLRILSPTSSDEDFNSAREDPESDDDQEISDSKKREPYTLPAAASKVKGKGKAKGQLHTLFDKLPTDVVYTIFSHLHPNDLLRLARTNRMLRSHLMSKSSASVWREAREEVEPPIPDCPPGQSEPQWAHLLLSRDCSTCGRTNIPHVDWYHRLRLCSRCDRAGVVLIIGSRARKALPQISDVNILLDLLPHSNTGSSHTGKYYRMKDIEDIGAEWANVKKEGDEAKIQEFKDRKRIIRKARGAGFDSRDFRDWQVVRSSFFSASTALTEQRWKTILPELEALINRVKDRRLRRERSQIVDQRRALADNLVKYYQITPDIAPAFRPGSWDLVKSESFQAIIDLPNEVSVTAAEFQPALDALPDLVSEAAKEIQSNLLQNMIDGGATNIDPSITESDFDKIHLATSTFFCKSSYNGLPVCGKDDLGAHACYGAPISHGKYHCLYYDRRASNAVAALLVAANLGQNTTVAQMDDMDLRFHCPGWLKQSTRLAMSWRDAASHARSSNQLHSRSWEVFSPEEIAAIKEKEMANIDEGGYGDAAYVGLGGLEERFHQRARASVQSEDDRGEPLTKKLCSGLKTLPLTPPSKTSRAL
ncbi:hypothetical protein M407DRAFT_34714 [Tulasnella calospora MUT 4182]|uniref:F-box domain-containing protein n=1 Tax=Tulasnella calospora MUT 4182 TaxID=1051891 RepID=A0A0C3K2Q5_9AGAM|nr:hypothetical protein M407DRAFT_34714 [Tulasnella calospora MUT 4182]